MLETQLAHFAVQLQEATAQSVKLAEERDEYWCRRKERCRVGHFWVLVAPEKHVLYRYSREHNGAAVDRLLPGYAGYLVADAHVVYDHLYRGGRVVGVGCWAHARRYLYKALASDPDRSKIGLAHIANLFRIERMIAGASRKKREAVRREQSAPIVERFFQWCDTEIDHVLDIRFV
jgi:hypothetical protein